LWARLDELHFFHNLLKQHITTARRDYEKWLSQTDNAHDILVSGVRLAVSDLTGEPHNGWPVFYPTAGIHARGKEYPMALDLVLERSSAWSVALGFEAFETFLKMEILRAIDQFSGKCKCAHVQRLFARAKKETASWQDVVGKRSSKDLMNLLRAVAPLLPKVESHNNRKIDLSVWLAVLTEVRHAITHSDFAIKNERIAKWPHEKTTLLAEAFPGNSNSKGYALHLSSKDAEDAITLLAEYGFAIFKALSCSFGQDWRSALENKHLPISIVDGTTNRGNKTNKGIRQEEVKN
jgi:hypothetical protein